MYKKKKAIFILVVYYFIMFVQLFIVNIMILSIGGHIVESMNLDINTIIFKFIMQVPPTFFVIYMVKKYFSSEETGLKKINKKNLVWFLPYIIVIIFMINKFIYEIIINKNYLNISIYIIMILGFIGTCMAGFCEEVIYRGIILNSFKNKKSIIPSMIISSLSFSILHIVTIFMGIPWIDVLYRIIYSGLLGFSFVGLVIKLNSIWPIIIFHILWNYIVMISQVLSIELSRASGLCNILNIFMAIILWSIIIMDEKRKEEMQKIYR